VKTKAEHPVFGLVDRLRSAVRTGRRLHLDPEHVQVLMDDQVYLALSKLEAREMRRLLEAAGTATSLASSGSGSGPGSSPGTSAGSSAICTDAVSRGASQLLRQEVDLTLRRKRRSMHSLHTM
jgi:hypothetical protein